MLSSIESSTVEMTVIIEACTSGCKNWYASILKLNETFEPVLNYKP